MGLKSFYFQLPRSTTIGKPTIQIDNTDHHRHIQ